MRRKARSARGVIVDFDLMKIKEQIASMPAPLEVKARQDFIENRLKRRLKKAQDAVIVESTKVEAEPKMPEPAAVDIQAESYIETADSEVEPKKKTTKQKARPTKKNTSPEK